MALATSKASDKYLNVSAGTGITSDFPLFATDELEVYYGNTAIQAVIVTDYTLTLAPDFTTFTITPTAALIAKIDALIAADPTESNFIAVRRATVSTTSLTKDTPNFKNAVADDITRTVASQAELNELFARTLRVNPSESTSDFPAAIPIKADRVAGGTNKTLVFDGTTGDPMLGSDPTQAETNAAASAAAAATSETNATTSATASEAAQVAAEAARDAALTAQTGAETAQTGAETAEAGAETARDAASASASTATAQATLASGYKDDAQAAETGAQAAQTAAETAQTAAETAQTGAETAETAAQSSATAAEAAQTAAEAAQTAAETAETGAETAQAAAEAAAASISLPFDTADIADDAITEPKLADDAVSFAKMAHLAAPGVIGADAAGPPALIAAASQAEMEAGTETALRAMSPERIKQAVDALMPAASWEYVSTTTASNDSTIDFTGFEAGYDYFIVAEKVVPASDNTAMWMRLGNGGVFDDGTNNYRYGAHTGGDYTHANGTSATHIAMHDNYNACGNQSGEYLNAEILIIAPMTANYTDVRISNFRVSASDNALVGQVYGRREEHAAHDRAQFLFQSGNVQSGKFRVYRRLTSA